MKNKRVLFVALIMILIFVTSMVLLVACDKEEPSDETPQDEQKQDDKGGEKKDNSKWYEISEEAMNNFIFKLGDANYVMISKVDGDEMLKTSVCSENLVTFIYNHEKTTSGDFTVMSLDYEVFQASLKSDGIQNVMFLNAGTAVEIAKPQLINAWLDDNNIWDLFTNDSEQKPLHFTSTSEIVQQSIAYFANIGEIYAGTIDNMELEFESKKADKATLKATYRPGTAQDVPIEVSITIGNAQEDERVTAWLDDADREYPEAMTSWEGIYELAIESVMMDQDVNKCVPFLDSISYATTINGNTFVDGVLYINDYKASPEDYLNYAIKLLNNGFEAHDDDGHYYFTKLLRTRDGYADQECYSLINLDYSNGLEITAFKSYNYKEYDILDDINTVISTKGFADLATSSDFTGYYAYDFSFEQTESMNYLFDYDLMLSVRLDTDNIDNAQDYIDAYTATLTGFDYNDKENYWVQKDTAGVRSFRYTIDEDCISILYKSEAYVSKSGADTYLSAESVDMADMSSASVVTVKNLKNYYRVQFGENNDVVYRYTLEFVNGDNEDKAEAFLNTYMAALILTNNYNYEPDVAGGRVRFTHKTKNIKIILGYSSPEQAVVEYFFPHTT